MPHHSVNEVARLKGVSPRTVYRAVTEGRLVAERVGRAVLIESSVAEAWTPMVTKARPQVRADEQLVTTLQSVLGYRGLAGCRHFALAVPDLDAYRIYLSRLMTEAANQEAALTLAVSALKKKDVEELATTTVGAEKAAAFSIVSADSVTQPADDFDPGRQIRSIREALEAGFAGGARQAWYSSDPPLASQPYLSGENLTKWNRFEEGLTRIMRHMPAMVSCVHVGENGMGTLAAFASCHPVCIVDGAQGFLLESSRLNRA